MTNQTLKKEYLIKKELEYKEYIEKLKPEFLKIKKKLCKLFDLDFIDILVFIEFVPEKHNIARYKCKTTKNLISCNLIKIDLDIYDIEETLKIIGETKENKKNLILYLVAHEYAHLLVFLKEPSLFRFKPTLLAKKRKKLNELYRAGYSTLELFADYAANKLFPDIQTKLLEKSDMLDYLGEPYTTNYKRIFKMGKEDFLKTLKNWTSVLKDKEMMEKVKSYKVKVCVSKLEVGNEKKKKEYWCIEV